VAEAVAYGEAAEVFDRWGREKVDVVLGIDAGYEEDLLRAAENYPDTAWVMMTALSDTKGLKNVASYSINWCQVGYAQGVLAALASKSGTIANVGAIKILPAELIIEGEKAGIAATGKDIEVITEYSGDFLAADKAAELASAVTSRGADVVIEVTNGAVAQQLAARVQEEGAGYVGTYLDSNEFAPKAHVATVTSDFSRDYADVVASKQDGSFETQQVDRGFEEGVLSLSPFGSNYKDIEKKARELIDSMEFPSSGKCAKAA
jgi:simple sugar transport system substrate-binding protein